MKIFWQFDTEDIARVTAFFGEHKDNHFVKARVATNLAANKPPISKHDFWERMVGCLLTTQQRSGPGSPVTKFLLTEPCPLEFSTCAEQDDLAEFARSVLSDFGGLRRSTTIGKELAANMDVLRDGGWESTLKHLDEVRTSSSPETKKWAAAFTPPTIPATSVPSAETPHRSPRPDHWPFQLAHMPIR